MNDKLSVQMKGISKHFGGVRALQGVDFEVYEDEVVGLVGDNGAGKSTLIKILAGVFPSDAGQIFFQGKQVKFSHPSEAKALGIQVIYQDLALVETFGVASNLFLANEIMKNICWGIFKIIDQQKMVRESQENLRERIGITINNHYDPVRILSGGERQAIAIAKAVHFTAKLIIMDEPTASLGAQESKKLFEIVKRLKLEGISVIIISHNLEHVFTLADRIIVLRRGRRVGTRNVSDTTKSEIVNLIIGAT